MSYDPLSDAQGLWAVTASNGSGTKVLHVRGTQRTAWTWVERAGAGGGIVAGEVWAPTGIEPASCGCWSWTHLGRCIHTV